MTIEMYLWMDGPLFSAETFLIQQPSARKGKILLTKKTKHGLVSRDRPYWQSEERLSHTNDIASELVQLASEYALAIQAGRALGADRVVAELVITYATTRDIGGMYFSPEAIKRLAALGVGIDIDVYAKFDWPDGETAM